MVECERETPPVQSAHRDACGVFRGDDSAVGEELLAVGLVEVARC
jgi:hypothetical protein